jgi:hypothetical protein
LLYQQPKKVATLWTQQNRAAFSIVYNVQAIIITTPFSQREHTLFPLDNLCHVNQQLAFESNEGVLKANGQIYVKGNGLTTRQWRPVCTNGRAF